MKKVDLEVMKPFITSKLNSLMPIEDEVIIEYVFSQLEQSQVTTISSLIIKTYFFLLIIFMKQLNYSLTHT